ncbi:MAG: hypothetical protein HW399_598 [Dehalococcoidia bacterium]|nr:hypothetical protein [Dehalococcoidia bacterium]
MEKTTEKALASCLDSLEHGDSLEQCLARYPHLSVDLEPLLRAALFVRQATRVTARHGYKVSSRNRILSSLKPSQSPVLKRRFMPWHLRWTAALASLLVILLGGGTIAFANNSLPDQPLYSVKAATEDVQLALAPNDMYRARMEMDLMDRRTDEIAELAKQNRFIGIERANQRLARHLDRFAAITANQEDNHTQARAELEALLERKAARHQAVLEGTLGRLPEPARPQLRNSIERSKASYQAAGQKIREEKLQKQKRLQEQKKRLQEQKPRFPRKNLAGKTSEQRSFPVEKPTNEPSQY